MNNHKLWALLVITAILSVGCVGQGEYDNLKTVNRKSKEQIIELRAQLDAKDEQIQAIRDAKPSENPDTLKTLAVAEAEIERLNAKLADLDAQLRKMSTMPGVLPEALNTALMDLAKSNPGLMTYDEKLGMVKFTSDLTFALGSVNLSTSAKTGLDQLARIVRSTNYDIRIVGHTDNVPIKAVRDQHPTNWHLSVHRAIAVKTEMEKAGIPAGRIMVAGHGEYRPIVPNGTSGAAANRRVEIYLVPSGYTAPVAAPEEPAPAVEEAAPEAEAPPAPAEDGAFK